MEDTMTQNIRGRASETLERAGSEISNMKDRAMSTAHDAWDRAKNTAEQYLENDPKATPRAEHREGPVARAIEQQTAKWPSDAFLWAAVGSMGLSLALEMMGEEKKANFVGHWAPTLLIFGLYNKMVKLHGSDGV